MTSTKHDGECLLTVIRWELWFRPTSHQSKVVASEQHFNIAQTAIIKVCSGLIKTGATTWLKDQGTSEMAFQSNQRSNSKVCRKHTVYPQCVLSTWPCSSKWPCREHCIHTCTNTATPQRSGLTLSFLFLQWVGIVNTETTLHPRCKAPYKTAVFK